MYHPPPFACSSTSRFAFCPCFAAFFPLIALRVLILYPNIIIHPPAALAWFPETTCPGCSDRNPFFAALPPLFVRLPRSSVSPKLQDTSRYFNLSLKAQDKLFPSILQTRLSRFINRYSSRPPPLLPAPPCPVYPEIISKNRYSFARRRSSLFPRDGLPRVFRYNVFKSRLIRSLPLPRLPSLPYPGCSETPSHNRSSSVDFQCLFRG